jgi:hypothetical protein
LFQPQANPGAAGRRRNYCCIIAALSNLYCFWVVAIGCWLLANSCWLLAFGCWLLAVGFWLLAVGYWLLAVGCWLLAFGYWWWLMAIVGIIIKKQEKHITFLDLGD